MLNVISDNGVRQSVFRVITGLESLKCDGGLIPFFVNQSIQFILDHDPYLLRIKFKL